MRSTASVLRGSAVVLAITLTAGYVWFRASQARPRLAPTVEKPTTAPATQPVHVMAGTKFSDLSRNLSYSYQNPYPSTTALGEGFKLNNSISAEFAVASDTKFGTINLLPAATAPATQPTTIQSDSK